MPATQPIPTPADFIKKWNLKFADNTIRLINEKTFREFAADITTTFGVQVVNVPAYQQGATYQDGYLVRFTPASGKESFFYSLQAGILPAPTTETSDKYWRLVPGPVSTVALSQELTLSQAKSIEGLLVVPGRSYIIDFGPDASGHAQLVTLLGTAANLFAIRGQLTVNGVRSNVRVNVTSGVFGQEAFDLLATDNDWLGINYFDKGVQFKNATGFDEYGQLFIYTASFGNKHSWRDNVYSLASDSLIGWRNADYTTSGTNDVGLARSGAGVLEVNTGTKGSPATLSVLDVLVSSVQNVALNSFSKLATVLGRVLSLVPANATRLVDTSDTRLQDLARGFIDYQNEIELYEEDVTNNGNSVVFATLPFQTGRAFRFNRHAASTVAATVQLPSPGYSNSYVLSFRIGAGISNLSSLTIKDNAGRVLIVLTGTQTAVVRGQYGGWSVLLSTGAVSNSGSGVGTPTGTELVFTQDAEYPTIYSGTFTVDVTGAKVGSVVSVRLGASAGAPSLPTSCVLLGDNTKAGDKKRYSFCVAPDNLIEYYVTKLP